MGLDGSLRYLRRESLVSNLMAPPEMSTRCNLIGWVMRKIFSEKLERNIPTSAQTEFGHKLQQNLAMFEQFTVAKMFRPEVLVLPATIFGEAAGWREQRV